MRLAMRRAATTEYLNLDPTTLKEKDLRTEIYVPIE